MMNPITQALFAAIEAVLIPRLIIGGEVEVTGFTILRDSPELRSSYADAPEGTLYIELPPSNPETRALWFTLLEAGAEPPMTAITSGEGNGVVVLLMNDSIEFYIQGDGPECTTLIAQFTSKNEGVVPSWTFQSG